MQWLQNNLFLIGYLTSNLKEVLNFVQTLQKRIPISSMYIKILLKLLAIAYICQIASNLCEDLGYHSISFQIETIGKLSILVLSIPIISSSLETIIRTAAENKTSQEINLDLEQLMKKWEKIKRKLFYML